MPQYRKLPNGQTLELPDNLTQEQINIVKQISQVNKTINLINYLL